MIVGGEVEKEVTRAIAKSKGGEDDDSVDAGEGNGEGYHDEYGNGDNNVGGVSNSDDDGKGKFRGQGRERSSETKATLLTEHWFNVSVYISSNMNNYSRQADILVANVEESGSFVSVAGHGYAILGVWREHASGQRRATRMARAVRGPSLTRRRRSRRLLDCAAVAATAATAATLPRRHTTTPAQPHRRSHTDAATPTQPHQPIRRSHTYRL
ncbi:Protein of unknown function [Gryllus bimaculatus]|nr:Protein of unknown function [Gryllus bimaculatus]